MTDWLRRPPGLGAALDRALARRLDWTPDALARHAEEALATRLDLAARLPGFRGVDLGPTGDDPRARLARAPLLPRDRLAAGAAPFLDPRWPRPLLRGARTSGTSGQRVDLLRDPVSRLLEQAFLRRQLRAWGWRPGWRALTIRGEGPLGPTGTRVERDGVGGDLRVSALRLDARGAREAVEAAREAGVRLLRGYPSALLELARLVEEEGLADAVRAWSPALLHVSSEVMTDAEKARLEAVFGAPVAEQYGQAERVLLIQSCPAGARHLVVDYGVGEVVDGEWVGTPLFGCLVLLRYRTGDFAGELPGGRTIAPPGCGCGWPFPLVAAVEGKRDDVLVTADGRRLRVIGPALRHIDGLLRFQVEVTRDGFVVRFDAAPARHAAVGREVAGRLAELLGVDIGRIALRPGEAPVRSGDGKLLRVVDRRESDAQDR